MPELAERPKGPSPVTAERVLLRVFVQAYLATAHEKPQRRARAFLRRASSLLSDEESLAVVLPIRAKATDREISSARRDALAIYEQLEPFFVAALPPE